VLYRGAIMEHADRARLFTTPLHPYTVALLSAVPEPERGDGLRKQRILLPGDVEQATDTELGCRFRTRCPVGRDRSVCATQTPMLTELEPRHAVACHFPGELQLSGAAGADPTSTNPGART